MSGSLEHLLDFTLDMREQRHRQHKADLGIRQGSSEASYKEFERRRKRFSTDIYSLIQKSVERANRHLATRPEQCEFCELAEFPTAPWGLCKIDCNPIAYGLRVNGREVGEKLVIELSHDGMIEALLWPFRFADQDRASRIDFGWFPTPLYSFDAGKAEELLVLYLTAITQRWRIDVERAE